MVVAMARNRVIGGDNKLLWHLPEDLKHFKKLTLDAVLIMGRKTFESLPGALPRRRHLVVSRNPNWSAAGAETLPSLEAAIERCRGLEIVFVVGGGEIYRQGMRHADRIELTRIDADFEGDTHFPEIDPLEFEIRSIRARSAERGSGPDYQFETWVRKPKPGQRNFPRIF